MTTINIKVLKPIERNGLPSLAVGREAEVLKELADKWIESGHAEAVNAGRKPIDIPKLLKKEAVKTDKE